MSSNNYFCYVKEQSFKCINKYVPKHIKWMQVFCGYYSLIWPQLLIISAASLSVNLWAESVRWHLCYLAANYSFPKTSNSPAVRLCLWRHIHTLTRTWCSADTWLAFLLTIYKRFLCIFVGLAWNKRSKSPYETQAWFFQGCSSIAD